MSKYIEGGMLGVMKYLVTEKVFLSETEGELYSDKPEYDYILIVPRLRKYITLGKFEAHVWRLVEAGMEVTEIVVELTEQEHKFEQLRIEELLAYWETEGVIYQEGTQPVRHELPWWQKIGWVEYEVKNIDNVLEKIYRIGGKYLFTNFFLALLIGMIIFGMTSLFKLPAAVNYDELSELDLLLIFLGSISCLFAHELGHGLAMKWARAKVLRGGAALYFGLPVFFVDTTAVWAKSKYKRIIVSLAGITVNFAIAASLSLIIYFGLEANRIDLILREIIVFNIFSALISLIPIIKMDGYYVLIDILGRPNLNNEALTKLRKNIFKPHKLFYNKESSLLTMYALSNIAATTCLIIYAITYWGRVFITYVIN